MKCFKCRKAHNSLLHLEFNSNGNSENSITTTGENDFSAAKTDEAVLLRETGPGRNTVQHGISLNSHASGCAVAAVSENAQVLLSTAVVCLTYGKKMFWFGLF